MPPGSGQIVSTLYDGSGVPLIIISEWYTPATGALRDVATSTSTGTKTGALVVDNRTGKTQEVTVTTDAGTVKRFSIPASGRVLTAAQLAALPAPDGPIETISDLAGLSTSLT
jgi:hypothetical protein